MRIAQVSPLYESVPPKLYGGTERVVHWLTEELVRVGHDVTLFASGDSQTSAELVPCCERALRLGGGDGVIAHTSMLERVAACAARFDVIHFHMDYFHLPLARRLPTRSLTTLHGRLDTPGIAELFRTLPDVPLVSISDSQRRPCLDACWAGTVYHGMPRELHHLGEGKGGYAVFLGRMSPEKRPDRAIEIALRSGVPVKIAAKVDQADREYFETMIRPLLDHDDVTMLGEVDETGKTRLLCDARVLLFPIDWPEPFGLALIEAMACGTPVIAFRCGSVPEVVDENVTGFVVDDIDAAVRAFDRIDELDRAAVRARLEERFTSEVMARAYERIYQRLLEQAWPPRTGTVLRLTG